MVQSKKTPGPALAVVLVLVGCADPAPPPAKVVEPPPKPTATVTETATATAEPEPVGDGSEAAPFRLKAGAAQALPIEVKVRPYSGFVLEESADVVLTWSGGEGFGVIGPDRRSKECKASPCILPLAIKGAYELTLPKGPEKLAVSASALALPKAAAVKPGRAVVLKTKAAAADDPRGPIADAVLHFDAKGEQQIDLRPLGGKRATAVGDPWSRLEVVIVGPNGRPASLTAGSSENVGGAAKLTFAGTAGDYVLRVVKNRESAADAVEVTLRKAGPAPMDFDEKAPELPARAASLAKLKGGGKVDVEVSRGVEPTPVWIDVPQGMDLAVIWKSSGPAVAMGSRRTGEDRRCDQSPCLYDRPHAGPLALFAYPSDAQATVTAEARALPWPSPLATLSPDQSAEVTTAAAGADDPRGAMGEIALDLATTDKLDLEVQIVDFPVTKDVFVAAKDRVTLTFFGPDGNIAPGSGPDIQSTANLLAGRYQGTFTPAAAGRHLLRIDGTGRPAGRKIKVSLKKSAPPPASDN